MRMNIDAYQCVTMTVTVASCMHIDAYQCVTVTVTVTFMQSLSMCDCC